MHPNKIKCAFEKQEKWLEELYIHIQFKTKMAPGKHNTLFQISQSSDNKNHLTMMALALLTTWWVMKKN